jgi:hypothetical protein
MDRRPPLEARPPALIDAAVRLLVPVPCREHVIGDLWERYRSPRSFVLDALRTIPFVVISQVRRTSTLSAVFIQLVCSGRDRTRGCRSSARGSAGHHRHGYADSARRVQTLRVEVGQAGAGRCGHRDGVDDRL